VSQTFSTIAQNASEAAYPHLWQGLAGVWSPSLGVTGESLRDVSGRKHHGTLQSMDPSKDWQASGGGWLLDFAGNPNRVQCGKRINDALINHITLVMWARFDSVASAQSIISTIASSGGNGQHFEVGRVSGKLSFIDSTSTTIAYATDSMTIGEHFVAVTRTGSSTSKTFSFFIDGQPAGTQTVSGTTRTDGGGGNFTIGRAGDYSGLYLNAGVRGAAAWGRALADAEIKALYQAGPGDWLKRKPRRVYSIPGPAFKAAWATRATTIAGVLR